MIKAAGVSHVGMKRSENQDNFLVSPEMQLFVVADGMGGHKGGETASSLAVKAIGDYFKAALTGSQLEPGAKVKNAVIAANQAIQDRGNSEPGLQGMGTTTTALHFANAQLFIGQVGDSRSYLIHPHRIWQITRDHSLVQEKLRAGLITRAQLKTDKMKNVITRSVGFENEVEVDVYHMEVHPGDVFVACSDGLSGMVDDSEILQIIESCVYERHSVEMAAQRLIEAACNNGGDDNVTAIVVSVEQA